MVEMSLTEETEMSKPIEMQISAAGGETYEVHCALADGEREFLGTIETPATDEDEVIDAAREEYGHAELPARVV